MILSTFERASHFTPTVVPPLHMGVLLKCYYSIILQDGVTPLMAASGQGHLPVVDTLLKHNATLDLKDEVWSECASY